MMSWSKRNTDFLKMGIAAGLNPETRERILTNNRETGKTTTRRRAQTIAKTTNLHDVQNIPLKGFGSKTGLLIFATIGIVIFLIIKKLK